MSVGLRTALYAGIGALVLALPLAVSAQDPGAGAGAGRVTAVRSRAVPDFTLLGGVGNSLGWLGVSGERYLSEGEVSLLFGIGYTPEIDGVAASPAFAVGARFYPRGGGRGPYGEISLSQQALGRRVFQVDRPGVSLEIEEERAYGPGLLIGWQWITEGGFTTNLGAGAGYSTMFDEGGWQPLLNLGFGFTWRPTPGPPRP